MTTPMFPPCIDSTMLSTFRSCPQKMLRMYVEHWKPKEESVHLVAGGAFASGLEAARMAFYNGQRRADGRMEEIERGNAAIAEALGAEALIRHYGDFIPPDGSAKTLDRMLGALEFYFSEYPLGADGAEPITLGDRRGIEFSFAQPLGINHPVSGDPIVYTGRADMIAHFAGGTYIFDEKTTSQLGVSWTKQWELRSQFTGYAWAAREAGIDVTGAIVRGVSILKTKYGTEQVLTNRPGWEIERWLDQTHRDIERMIACWKAGWWDYNLDHACSEYGGCGMTRICKSQEPTTWLPMYFEQRVWDPLARKELTIGEWEEQWSESR